MLDYTKPMEELLKIGCRMLLNEPMAEHTTLGIGGPAQYYAEVETLDQLCTALRIAREKSLPVFFMGMGSNLLVGDKGILGLTLRLKGEFQLVSFEEDCVYAGAGVFIPTLIKQCADKGLGGAEPLVGIPGTLGGALIMNAGTRELEIGSLVKTVEVLNSQGDLERLNRDQIRFNYRASSLEDQRICFATLQLRRVKKEEILRKVQSFLQWRLDKQPLGMMNVGSIFKNPPGHFAAQFIESANLKGFKIGQAQVSPQHANFIVNLGGARAEDVQNLILTIQKVVKEKHRVNLEIEVKRVGL